VNVSKHIYVCVYVNILILCAVALPCWSSLMSLCRASIEPNFHDLYLKFLDKVYSKALSKEIVQNSYENCKVCVITCIFVHWTLLSNILFRKSSGMDKSFSV